MRVGDLPGMGGGGWGWGERGYSHVFPIWGHWGRSVWGDSRTKSIQKEVEGNAQTLNLPRGR